MQYKTELDPKKTYESIKLGIDAHAKWCYVARRVDGATPHPVHKMSLAGLLRFVAKQQRLAPTFTPATKPVPSVTNCIVRSQRWE